jgi:hypothetical protein
MRDIDTVVHASLLKELSTQGQLSADVPFYLWDTVREGIQLTTPLFFDRRVDYVIKDAIECNNSYPANKVHRSVLRSLK